MLKKKPYLLLELLIGIALIAGCALPLIRYPLVSLQKQSASLERMELERLALQTFAQVKEKLYQNAIPWKELTKETPGSPYRADVVTMSLGEHWNHPFERQIYLSSKNGKIGQNREEYRLLHVNIRFKAAPSKQSEKPISFLYKLLVVKIPKKVEPKEI